MILKQNQIIWNRKNNKYGKEIVRGKCYEENKCHALTGTGRNYPTYFDQGAAGFEEITVSAGIRGCQLTVNREQLLCFLDTALLELTLKPS